MDSDKTVKAVKESVGKIILILADAVYILEKDMVSEWDEERIRMLELLREVIDTLKKAI